MNFDTFLTRKKRRFYAHAGSVIEEEFAEDVNFRGRPVLRVVGHVDLRELHNADRDCANIDLIMRRCMAGDVNAFEQRKDAFYADITELPDTPMEAARRALVGRQMFDALSLDTKAKYHNNSLEWLQAISDGEQDALESIGVVFKTKEPEGVEQIES